MVEGCGPGTITERGARDGDRVAGQGRVGVVVGIRSRVLGMRARGLGVRVGGETGLGSGRDGKGTSHLSSGNMN